MAASASHRPGYLYGRRAERLVRLHLRLRGYRIVAANVHAGGSELDVVARRGGLLVVCEVKARSAGSLGDPLEAVGPEKLRRLRRGTEALLAQRPDLALLDVAIEVAAVRGWRLERVRVD